MAIWRSLAVFAALTTMIGHDALADMPQRVVSMNVCTDQLALLIGEQGQIASVSDLAADPRVSVLADMAANIPVNQGLAEEIFLLKPDLVLTGTFTTSMTASLLRQLGIRVEEFEPESDFDDIRGNILRMGDLLGQSERARTLLKEFDDGLAMIAAKAASDRPLAVPFFANSYTSGRGTLPDEIFRAAGLRNLATELGYSGADKLPLEAVILHDPDFLIVGDREYNPPSLAQEVLDHPALQRAFGKSHQAAIESRYWICGGPFTVAAVAALTRLHPQARP